jgi:hypothetical protein
VNGLSDTYEWSTDEVHWIPAQGDGLVKKYPYPEGPGPVKWVSTEWLAEHLTEPCLTIIDVESNSMNT